MSKFIAFHLHHLWAVMNAFLRRIRRLSPMEREQLRLPIIRFLFIRSAVAFYCSSVRPRVYNFSRKSREDLQMSIKRFLGASSQWNCQLEPISGSLHDDLNKFPLALRSEEGKEAEIIIHESGSRSPLMYLRANWFGIVLNSRFGQFLWAADRCGYHLCPRDTKTRDLI